MHSKHINKEKLEMIRLNEVKSLKHISTACVGEFVSAAVTSTLPHSSVSHDFVNPYHSASNRTKS